MIPVGLLRMTHNSTLTFALLQVAADGPGLYTGPVFTAASTGPLFST